MLLRLLLLWSWLLLLRKYDLFARVEFPVSSQVGLELGIAMEDDAGCS